MVNKNNSHKNREQFLLAFQDEEENEPQRLPQRKNTRSKQWKTASKPARILFEENALPETAPQTASDLLPSPSEIDPDFLAALPDDVRQEIEQHYKRKDSHATRGGSHVTRGDSHVLLEDSHVARVHIQTRLPGDRVSERNAVTFKSDDVQKKGKTEVAAPRKQVHFYSLFRNLKGLSCQFGQVLVENPDKFRSYF